MDSSRAVHSNVACTLQPGTRAQRTAGLEAQPSASMPLQPESARGESQIPTFAPYRPQVCLPCTVGLYRKLVLFEVI